MKRIIVIAAITVLFLLSGSAVIQAEEPVNFEAQLGRTTLTSQTCNEGVCNAVFEGPGTSNVVGPMSWTAYITEDFNISPCNPTSNVIILEGTTGSITVADSGVVCQSYTPVGIPAFISSDWVVVAGTGEFSGITGTGISRGATSGNGPEVHLSGMVTY